MDSLLTKEQNKILPIMTRKKVECIIEGGARLQAIKLIKDNTGLGLRECKHIADCIREEMIVSKARGTALDHMIKEREKHKIK